MQILRFFAFWQFFLEIGHVCDLPIPLREDGGRDVAAAPQTPQLGEPRPTLGAQGSLKLLFGYVTIFSSADLFTTDLNCRKKLACDIISECYVILSRRILNIRLT